MVLVGRTSGGTSGAVEGGPGGQVDAVARSPRRSPTRRPPWRCGRPGSGRRRRWSAPRSPSSRPPAARAAIGRVELVVLGTASTLGGDRGPPRTPRGAGCAAGGRCRTSRPAARRARPGRCRPRRTTRPAPAAPRRPRRPGRRAPPRRRAARRGRRRRRPREPSTPRKLNRTTATPVAGQRAEQLGRHQRRASTALLRVGVAQHGTAADGGRARAHGLGLEAPGRRRW